MTLYHWHNGARIAEYELAWERGGFLSLEDAVRIYEHYNAVYEEEWYPWWFPVCSLEGHLHVVECPPRQVVHATVYYLETDDPWPRMAYDSLTSMLETCLACYEVGAYRCTAQGDPVVDWAQEAAQPQVVEVFLPSGFGHPQHVHVVV